MKTDGADPLVSDRNEAFADANPLQNVAPETLAELSHLDLSGSVVFKESRVITGGSYGDISTGHCWISSRGHVRVAVKRLRFYLKEDIKLLFEKEIYVWSKLKHPNVLPLLGYAIDQMTGYPLLVSEWMENGSAWTYVNSHPECSIIPLLVGIARGLAYLHGLGVIHSDIKSDNILISAAGEALLCDFGCSRMILASRSLANLSSGIRGTPRYLAYELLVEPEALDGHSSGHTMQTDVWAFGMTVFELCTRQRPFSGLTDMQVLSAVTRLKLPPFPSTGLSDASPRAAQMIQQLCSDCWNRNPKQRPSMQSVLTDLEKSAATDEKVVDVLISRPTNQKIPANKPLPKPLTKESINPANPGCIVEADNCMQAFGRGGLDGPCPTFRQEKSDRTIEIEYDPFGKTESACETVMPRLPNGATLGIGIPCIITSKRKRFRAFARYIGEVKGEHGPWVGVEVPMDGDTWTEDEKAEAWGGSVRPWNDGTWCGIQYFDIRSSISSGWGDADQSSEDRKVRFRSSSSSLSDSSCPDCRGLFVRPQQVLYVVDAVGSD